MAAELQAMAAQLSRAAAVPLALRRMTEADLPQVMLIQELAYPPHLHESLETMARRRAAYAEGQFVVTAPSEADGDRVVGYAQSHPWLAALPPPTLDLREAHETITLALARPPAERYYHVHDVATVLPRRGVGRRLMAAALRHAAEEGGFSRAGCVAVMGMEAVWARCGFAVVRPLEDASYAHEGRPAVWMEADLRSGTAWGTSEEDSRADA
jgi:ribosomal protein S18 acetylase RimI-like enzyme